MHNTIKLIIDTLNETLLNKTHQVKLSIACLLAGGHLLIEDLPGTGKTTLAYALATILGLDFKRIQFTSDLLPADILGSSVYDNQQQIFKLRFGPIFTNILLADEINRASPKAQSALLEAMEEHQVSIEGETYPLTLPFFVIATQNPQYFQGVFPLPESQLDRFLMKIALGYPEQAAELAIMRESNARREVNLNHRMCDAGTFLSMQTQAHQTHASEAILEYVLKLISTLRAQYPGGLSVRASVGVINAAKAWAFISGRAFVTPEDVQSVFHPVIAHRLQGEFVMQDIQQLLQQASLI